MRVLRVGSTEGGEREREPRDPAPEEARGQQPRERMKGGRLQGALGEGRAPLG